MRSSSRSEMNKLLWWFTIPVLLLVTVIVGYYLIDGVVSANNNAKHTKQLMINQTFESYKKIAQNFETRNFSLDMVRMLNPTIVQSVLKGDPTQLYGVIKNLQALSSPVSYLAVVADGKIADSMSAPGVKVDAAQVPKGQSGDEYKIISSLGNMKGTLMQVTHTIDLKQFGVQKAFTVVTVYDLTKQVKAIDKYFNDQKRSDVIKLTVTAIVALVLFALLSIFWLRHLIDRYIRQPVERLNETAEEIAAGTFEGEVVVDPNSDFAALQGLLKSGQLILRKFNVEMDDKTE